MTVRCLDPRDGGFEVERGKGDERMVVFPGFNHPRGSIAGPMIGASEDMAHTPPLHHGDVSTARKDPSAAVH